ncbi:MAG TPA: prephenate dehydrogenase/arogenate dehydrogenase family protein [Gemmataceae bacterium]|nr:prephenate dehydrogenase/arogenate dehydrogenase family protein [Gemmataceae bacterium]
MDHDNPTIGILYPGELGAALGRILMASGRRVITALEGRGPRTQRLCREVGLEVAASFAEVVRRADVVFSAVPPSAALAVAEQYSATVGGEHRLYVDVNSISPETVARIGRMVQAAGADFVDAAVLGLAARLPAQGALFLSGPDALGVAALFEEPLRVRVVGKTPGQASALKSALAGLNKGLAALFFEVGVLAHEAGLSAAFLQECAAYYPGLMEVIDRLAPTYPRHARRRADEMAELEHTMETRGLAPRMALAARSVIAAAAESGWADAPGWTTAGVLEELHRRGALRARRQE